MKRRIQEIVALTRKRGWLRPRDLVEVGIAREYLRMAVSEGHVERVGRGLYRLPGAMGGEHRSLAEVCKRYPAGVVCLLSALQFHELTTQNPAEVWLAIGEGGYLPRGENVGIRAVRYSGVSFSEGVERHVIDGVEVAIYGVGKTVADCFKFRNKIGLDVAIEALRECLRERRVGVDELGRYAKVCRVERVMRPYMEAML